MLSLINGIKKCGLFNIAYDCNYHQIIDTPTLLQSIPKRWSEKIARWFSFCAAFTQKKTTNKLYYIISSIRVLYGNSYYRSALTVIKG